MKQIIFIQRDDQTPRPSNFGGLFHLQAGDILVKRPMGDYLQKHLTNTGIVGFEPRAPTDTLYRRTSFLAE